MSKVVGTMMVLLGLVAAVPVQSQDLRAKGEAVYSAQRCQLCHSVAGKGNTKGPLDGIGSRLTADELREWIVNPSVMTEKTKAGRKPAMPASSTLGKDDLNALVAFMQALKQG